MQWLKMNLNPGDHVGADPKLVSADLWLEWLSDLGIDNLNGFFIAIWSKK